MKTKYRFLSEKHRHQLFINNVWTDITGGSTVVDVLGKVLTYWAAGLALEKIGWINNKLKIDGKYQFTPLEKRLAHLKAIREQQSKLDDKQYLDLLDEAYKAHAVRLVDSAGAGTDMHALLEEYVKQCLNRGGEPEEYKGSDVRVKEFSEWAVSDIKRFIWSEAHCYDEDLFVGGISDVGAEMKDGSYVIIDFKSAKEAYFSHFVQVAIYNVLIEKNGLVDKDGKALLKLDKSISKYFIIPFGTKEFTVYENTNVDGLKKAALACIELYKQKSMFEIL